MLTHEVAEVAVGRGAATSSNLVVRGCGCGRGRHARGGLRRDSWWRGRRLLDRWFRQYWSRGRGRGWWRWRCLLDRRFRQHWSRGRGRGWWRWRCLSDGRLHYNGSSRRRWGWRHARQRPRQVAHDGVERWIGRWLVQRESVCVAGACAGAAGSTQQRRAGQQYDEQPDLHREAQQIIVWPRSAAPIGLNVAIALRQDCFGGIVSFMPTFNWSGLEPMVSVLAS